MLSPGGGIYKLKTNVFGPLPKGTFGLILGCSSAALRGLTIIPGVIDSDYVGEILIMVSTSTTLSLLAGDHIAQILLLPYHPFLALPNERTGGFGSTGWHIFWEMLIKDSRPVLSLIIQGKNFEGLVDTGQMFQLFLLNKAPRLEKRKKPSTADGIGLHCRCLEEYPSLAMPIP